MEGEDSSDVTPICILFVTKGTKGDRLLFKYPFSNGVSDDGEDQQTNCRNKQSKNMYAIKIEEDLFSSKTQSSSSLLKDGQLVGLSDDIMAFLFAVRQEICAQPLEVKINDVRFVCYPTLLHTSASLPSVVSSSAVALASSAPHLATQTGGYLQNSGSNCNNFHHSLSASATTNSNSTVPTHGQQNLVKNGQKRDRTSKLFNEDLAELPNILLFNIVFGLQGNARRSVVQCYQDLSKHLAITLRHEEHRCQYLTKECKIMMDCIEEMQISPEAEPESLYKFHLEKSQLAEELKQVFIDVKERGIVNIFINRWIKVSFCLPQKIHCFPGIGSMEPDKIRRFIDLMRPYHGVLLLKDVQSLLEEIPTDGSPDLGRLLRFISPLVSFQRLSSDTDLPLSLVFNLVGHLVYWGKATIIYPLCETNIYCISPTAPFDSPELSDEFAQTFPHSPCMFSTLSEFSTPISLGDFTSPLNFDPRQQSERVQMVVWFLKRFMLLQLRTYVFLLIDESDTARNKFSYLQEISVSPNSDPDLPVFSEDYEKIRQILLKNNLKQSEIDFIFDRYKDNKDDLRLFAKLCKYFNGNYHLEDIMFRENLRRNELMRILTKFNEILVTCTHEDELSSLFIDKCH